MSKTPTKETLLDKTLEHSRQGTETTRDTFLYRLPWAPTVSYGDWVKAGGGREHDDGSLLNYTRDDIGIYGNIIWNFTQIIDHDKITDTSRIPRWIDNFPPGPYTNPHDAASAIGDDHPCFLFSLHNIDQRMTRNDIPAAAQEHATLLCKYAPFFQKLAEFSKSGREEPNFEEKQALLVIMGAMGDHSILPEVYTRLVNPSGSLGDKPSYQGLTAYFYDLGLHIDNFCEVRDYRDSKTCGNREKVNACVQKYGFNAAVLLVVKNSEESVNKFWHLFSGGETPKGLKFAGIQLHGQRYLAEGARLLGMAARQWGLDKPGITDQEIQAIGAKAERFFTYLFVSKAAECIKDRVYRNFQHNELLISSNDVNAMRDYGKNIHDPLLPAEQKLKDEMAAMFKPDSLEYPEIQNLEQNTNYRDKHRPAWARIQNYDMMREKEHALNFLLPDNQAGKKLIHSL